MWGPKSIKFVDIVLIYLAGKIIPEAKVSEQTADELRIDNLINPHGCADGAVVVSAGNKALAAFWFCVCIHVCVSVCGAGTAKHRNCKQCIHTVTCLACAAR